MGKSVTLPPGAKDLTGRRFGWLTVLHYVPVDKRGAHWRCRCGCGKECVVNAYYLVQGNSTSCGCKLYVLQKHKYGRIAYGHDLEEMLEEFDAIAGGY